MIQLREVIGRFLSPNSAAIKEAEAYMKTIETQQGFTLVLLSLIQSLSSSVAPSDVAVRQTAAVIFKNAVKARWAPEDDNIVPLPVADRPPIKAHLVDLMCTTPEGASYNPFHVLWPLKWAVYSPAAFPCPSNPLYHPRARSLSLSLCLFLSVSDVQRQLAEAVAIVATYDFPDQWDTLLGLLATKLQQSNGDLRVVKGVMTTANSVMKRFRGAFKTDALFMVLKKCVDEFHTVLMATFAAVSARVPELSAGGAESQSQLVAALECLRLMSRIFFSLNWQVTGPNIPSYYPNTNTPLITMSRLHDPHDTRTYRNASKTICRRGCHPSPSTSIMPIPRSSMHLRSRALVPWNDCRRTLSRTSIFMRARLVCNLLH